MRFWRCWFALSSLFFTLTARADWSAELEAPFRQAVQTGSFASALILIFLAGLATSLTPCVYPMIVITVSVFGARQSQSRWQGAMLSTFFVLGMASLFTPLGVLAAVTGGVFGAALAHPAVLVGLALLFVALALSMFGAFEFNLPMAWRNRLAQVGGVGRRGAFALGLVSALIAAPCTGPVLAFLLTWVGTTGNVAFGALSLFVYALGLGVLFWLVGTFAISLPKSGRWLEAVKSIFGIVMLVMAIYYLRDLLPGLKPDERRGAWLWTGLALVVVGLLLGAVHASFHSPLWQVRLRKALGVGMAVLGSCLAIAWLQALPPGAKVVWLHDAQAARALAQQQHKPMLVDFGASWCGACRELEQHTFSDPRVVAAMRDIVAVHIDLSPGKDTAANRAALASYGQKGLPLVVLHHADGRESTRITAFVPPERLLHLLAALH